MRSKGKSSKKVALKKLHGALKSILGSSEEELKKRKDKGIVEILPGAEAKRISSRKRSPPVAVEKKNGLTYIVSREKQLIPMLTDDEIMQRHKLADENMKTAWTSIINKYESVEDQGDVIDLRTGEVVEDYGHLRGLSHELPQDSSHYRSTLTSLLGVKNEEDTRRNLWQDGDDDEDDEEYNSENEAREEEDTDTDSQISEYEKVLNTKIRD